MAPCKSLRISKKTPRATIEWLISELQGEWEIKVGKVSKRHKLVDLLPMPQIQRAYLKEEISFQRYIIWGSNLTSF